MNYLSIGEVWYALIFGVCIYFCWYNWKMLQPFKGFPVHYFGRQLFYGMITRRYPKGISFTSLLISDISTATKRFQGEDFFVTWLFQPIVILCNNEHVKKLLDDPANMDKPSFYRILSDLTGKGLLTHNGSTWKKHRHIMNPAFRLKMLKNQMSTFNRIAKEIVSQISELMSDDSGVEISDLLRIGTLKAVCEFAFGLKTDNKKYDKKFLEAGKTVECLETYTIKRYTRPWLHLKAFQMFFEEGREHKKHYSDFQDFTKYIIAEMTNTSFSHTQETGGSEDEQCRNKTVNHILNEKLLNDSTFTMKDMEGEIRNILVAGHSPLSYALLWCLFMLGHHPDVQERAFDEVQSVTGSSDIDISYTDSNQLEYLESVIKETLRIYPVIPFFARQTSKEIECGKYRIPKNTFIAFCLLTLHKDPNIYPDPEKFDPGRFYGDDAKQPWTFFSFSEGYRTCLGKNLAMLEMKIFLAHILKKFKIISLDAREDIGIDWTVTLKPAKSIRFKFILR